MTRKDYVLMAKHIKGLREALWRLIDGGPAIVALDEYVIELCKDLEWDNPKFNRNTFLKACGVPE